MVGDEDERLNTRVGKVEDLEEKFIEVVECLVEQVIALERVNQEAPMGQASNSSIGIYGPEITGTVKKLLDAVSNTVMMDPH